MKKLLLLSIALIGLLARPTPTTAQGVGINPSGTNPDPSAMIDVSSTTKGALLPRMTATQMSSIQSPAVGLIVYNTDCNTLNYFNGTSWIAVGNSNAVPSAPTATAAGNITGTSFSANWNSTATATDYSLDVATDAAFIFFVPGYNNLNVGNVTTYSVTGVSLGCNINCYYRIRANNGCGSSVSSNTIIVSSSAKSFQVDNGCSLTSGLISYWKMEGNSNDFYGTNNGTDNSMTYSTGNGKVNQGAGFNGGSSLITAAFPSGLTGNHIFSISFWMFNTNSSNKGWMIVFGSPSTNNAYGMGYNFFPNMSMGFWGTDANTGISMPHSWTHVVATYDGTNTQRLYLNGVLSFTNTAGSPNLTAGSLQMGRQLIYSEYYTGSMDEVGIWNKVLSTQEINDLYNGGSGQTMQ